MKVEKNNIRINGISVSINDEPIVLTIDEAKELYNKLHEFFGAKTTDKYPYGIRDTDKIWRGIDDKAYYKQNPHSESEHRVD
jgi:hypothetical protein